MTACKSMQLHITPVTLMNALAIKDMRSNEDFEGRQLQKKAI
jgi:hypothetical protein